MVEQPRRAGSINREELAFSRNFLYICIVNALCEKVQRNLRVPISRIVLASLFEPRDFDFNNG